MDMEIFLGKNYLFKNQRETYRTIFTSDVDHGKLFGYTNQILYDQVSMVHGSGKDLIGTSSYDMFMEDKWDLVHCKVKETIENILNSNLLDN